MQLPTQDVDTESVFGLTKKFSVQAFETATEAVPLVDPHYHFEPTVTEAILLGFATNRRVFVHGAHGSDLPPGTSPLSKLDLGPFEVHSMV